MAAGARVLLAYSHGDPAGRGTAEALRARGGWRSCPTPIPRALDCSYNPDLGAYLAGFREDTIELDFLDTVAPRDVEAYIVLSRHSGGRPSLTAHYPGNPSPQAPYGGRPRELAHTWPRLMAALFRRYARIAAERGLASEFSLTLEATHHGPTSLEKPIVFIEIGSSEEQWGRRDAHEAMAEAVALTLQEGWLEEPCTTVAIGMGDTHYPAKHTKALLEKGVCYSHIFSKHVLAELTEKVLRQAVEKSMDRVEKILLAKVPSAAKRLAQGFAGKHGLALEKL